MAAFYSYAYPMPKGFEDVEVVPGAYYEPKLSEFILPYEAVRESFHPDQLLIDFCQSTYDAAANLSKWDRELEESPYLNALREKHSYPTKYNLRHLVISLGVPVSPITRVRSHSQKKNPLTQ